MPWVGNKFIHDPDLAPALEKSIAVEQIKREREAENDTAPESESLDAVTERARKRFDAHARSIEEAGGSIPPPPNFREEAPSLTKERAAEIAKLIQDRALLGAFGVMYWELQEFCRLAKEAIK